MNRVVLGLLLLLYPRAWRARYGQQLRHVIAQTTAAGRSSWRTGVDVARAAAAVRAKALGIVGAGVTRQDRAIGGCVLVLWAWAAFVVAGAAVLKTSEHWQGAVPTGDRALPTAAFAALVTAAGVGTVMVLGGIAVTLPRVVAMLSGGGWPQIRGPVLRAASVTLVAAVWTLGLAVWAHRLGSVARNGGNTLFGGAFVGWALSVAVSLAAWTAVASLIARHIGLGRRLLVAEALLAGAGTCAMAVMSVAAVVWWWSVGRVAPGVFSGASAATPVVVAIVLMAGSTCLGIAGTTRAARELGLV